MFPSSAPTSPARPPSFHAAVLGVGGRSRGPNPHRPLHRRRDLRSVAPRGATRRERGGGRTWRRLGFAPLGRLEERRERSPICSLLLDVFLLLRPVNYHEGGGGSSLPHGCAAAILRSPCHCLHLGLTMATKKRATMRMASRLCWRTLVDNMWDGALQIVPTVRTAGAHELNLFLTLRSTDRNHFAPHNSLRSSLT
jgi:hypothetical protein